MKTTTFFRALVVMLFFVFLAKTAYPQTWEQTDITSLTSNDVFLIVDVTSGTALSHVNGSSSAPPAVSITFNDDSTAIIGEISDELKWNISGNEESYHFYPNGTTATWLYCTNSNNGVRIGTNANNNFVLDSNWLKNLDMSRWLGVYTPNPDWRCYLNTGTNIARTVTKFYKYVNNSTVATPTFSLPGGRYVEPQQVSITCETPNSTILYTLDGSTPNHQSDVYTAPISLNETTVLKAIAYTDNDTSVIATVTYVFPILVDDIATLRQGTTGTTLYQLTGEAVLTLQSSYRHVKYIQDATAAILIDDNSGIITTSYALGDGITGIIGTLTLYNGMLQFIPVQDPGAATSHDNIIIPRTISLDEMSNFPAELVTIPLVMIDGTGIFNASNSYNLNGNNATVLRTNYSDLDYIGDSIPQGSQDITGVVLIYNSVSQIIPRSMNDIVASPVTCSTPAVLNACNVSDLTTHSATFSASINDLGEACMCLEHGFVYSSINAVPSLTAADCQIEQVGNAIADNVIFEHTPTLSQNTDYYVRAYAINNFDTAYSEVVDFTTLTPQVYTISFVVDGSQTAIEPILYTQDEPAVTLPAVASCETFVFAGWTSNPIPEGTTNTPDYMTAIVPSSDTTLYALFVRQELNAVDSIEISRSSFASGQLSYNFDDQWTCTSSNQGNTILGYLDLYSNTTQTSMQCRSDRGTLPYNVTAIPGAITRIRIVGAGEGSPRTWTPYLSTTDSLSKNTFLTEGIALPEQIGENNAATLQWDVDPADSYRYFYLKLTGGATYLNSIQIVYNNGVSLYTTHPADTTVFYEQICSGDFYSDNGFSENIAGTYYVNANNQNACNLVYELHLTVNEPFAFDLFDTVCQGAAYQANGFNIPSESTQIAGTLTDTLHLTSLQTGCDSAVTLHLTINELLTSDIYDVVCQGAAYQANGFNIPSESTQIAGTLTDTLHLTSLQTGCDSTVTLHLTINEILTSDVYDTICQGAAYQANGFNIPSESTQIAGTLTDTLHLTSLETGCDSAVTLHLTINELLTSDVYDTVCQGAAYQAHGFNIPSESTQIAGTLTDTLHLTSLQTGCDSAVTLHLTINELLTSDVYDTVCQGTAYQANGFNIPSESTQIAGTLTETLHLTSLQTGCDSAVTLHLTINAATRGVDMRTAYDSFTWIDGNTYTASTNSPTWVLTNANGCDSVVTLHLTIIESVPGVDYQIHCDSFTWIDGVTYTESTNSPTWTITDGEGNDSTVTLHLTINELLTSDVYDTVCQGAAYQANGFNIPSESTQIAGTLTDTLHLTSLQTGCDSTVTLHLIINELLTSDVYDAVCQGTAYQANGFNIPSESTQIAGTLTETLHLTSLQTGCDSAVTLHLTINEILTSDVYDAVCQGTAYQANGFNIPSESTQIAGTLTDTLRLTSLQTGCDSTVTLHLTINELLTSDVYDVVCQGAAYQANGFNIPSESTQIAGTLTETLHLTSLQTGCDSTVTLHLTINEILTSDVYDAVCQGTAYQAHGFNIPSESTQIAGTLTDTLHLTSLETGCDSAVTLHLIINELLTSDVYDVVCQGTAYQANGFNIPSESTQIAGTLTETLHLTSLQTGCDSTVTLHLTINELLTSDVYDVVCQGTAYQANGFNIPSESTQIAGTLTETLHLTSLETGCDSVVTLHLIINELLTSDVYDTVCQGAAYQAHGFNIPSESTQIAGTLTETLHLTSLETGCDSAVTLHLTINELPEVLISGDSLLIVGNSGILTASSGSNYEWSTGETTQSITISPSDTTEYFVIVSNESGCSDTAFFTVYVTSSISNYEQVFYNIYPNPTDNSVTIEADNLQLIRLFNVNGQLLLSIPVRGSSYEIDTKSYADGIYFVEMMLKDARRAVQKLVIRH